MGLTGALNGANSSSESNMAFGTGNVRSPEDIPLTAWQPAIPSRQFNIASASMAEAGDMPRYQALPPATTGQSGIPSRQFSPAMGQLRGLPQHPAFANALLGQTTAVPYYSVLPAPIRVPPAAPSNHPVFAGSRSQNSIPICHPAFIRNTTSSPLHRVTLPAANMDQSRSDSGQSAIPAIVSATSSISSYHPVHTVPSTSPVFPPKLPTTTKRMRVPKFAATSARNVDSEGGASANATMSARCGLEIEHESQLRETLLVSFI